ncbi:electrogenic sodium bicarbonate cotransporter 4-like isoform X1 [Lates japonicus]|uniref:Electrogenic sodium bicarbonate cotransporter 4-like isoform X1 n=1 Tax=Lates japonicus TaxID=270547 RepID=A0AAD3NIY2_LATJO|nr:electrogenic sodium bicarbonate cotransporter 4-like isoform X1 [Lates japonicus]GLD73317.1 electrogenic sodium bicarbonate cotransporter 4-like isoform X1 [Lates japonicus]
MDHGDRGIGVSHLRYEEEEDHQSIYIGVPVPRGYRRKRRRRRSSREASDMDRDRRYSHHRHHEHDRYQDIDIEEGLMDSTEQSLQDINRTTVLTVNSRSQSHSLRVCSFCFGLE